MIPGYSALAKDALTTSGSNGRSANATVVEAADTCSAAVQVLVSASASIAELADTVSASAVVGTVALADADLVEAADTCSGSIAVLVQCNAELVEAPDTMGAVSTVPVVAVVTLVEAADIARGFIVDINQFRSRARAVRRLQPAQATARLTVRPMTARRSA